MAVDAHAASLGLRPGMAVAHAQAMVPGLRIEEAQPEQDAAALHRLTAWCLRQFSPLSAACPPDGIWIDVTGCTHLFADAAYCRDDTADGTRDGSADPCKQSAAGGVHAVAAGARDGSTNVPEDGTEGVRGTARDDGSTDMTGHGATEGVRAAGPRDGFTSMPEESAKRVRGTPTWHTDKQGNSATDVHGAAGGWDGEAGLLHALTTRLAEAGIVSRAAMADTPGAAYALARYGQLPPRPTPASPTPAPTTLAPTLARPAPARSKPDRSTSAHPTTRSTPACPTPGRPAPPCAAPDRPETVAAGYAPDLPIIAPPGGVSRQENAAAGCTPDAPIIAPPGCTRAALSHLPVAGLRLAEETVLALRTLGFDTIGQLMAAPRAPLAKRFGADVLRRLDQATGAVFEPIEPAPSPETPRTRQGFPEPISTPDDLARAAALLTDRLCEKLAQKGLGASRLDLVFQRVDGAQQAIRIGTAAATRDPGHLTRLLAAQIETIDPGFGIESVMLAAPLTARLGARQTLSELCATRHSPDLADLVDTLSNRLGTGPLCEARLFRAAPVQSDVPERSVRALPPLAPAEGADWPDRLPRPARLFTPPRRIEAVALLPDRAPAAFTWCRRVRRVRRADGPERIFGEWWREEGETWAVRDYFAVEDEAGQRFWLFRRGDGECAATGDLQWFLHGVFG